jgi:hypothetical protein
MSNTEMHKQVAEKRMAARRALWSRIKTEAPDCAEFIEMMTGRYGKPERVTVTLNTGETLDSSAVRGGG